MRLTLFVCLTMSLPASATVISLGLSNNISFTGLGGNASGQGTSRVTWGSCAFDGTNTKCTVSGPFTGLGGGTYNFVLTYPGNGPSPLTAISQTPGNDQVFFNLTAGSLVMTLAESNGTTVTFYQPVSFNIQFSNPTCTGVGSCAVGQVGLTANSTITGPVTGAFDCTPVIRAAQGVITASDYGGFSAIAPATWVEIYGTNLATIPSRIWGGADFNGNLAPSALAGTTVTIGGKQAFTYYVSPGQIDVQMPSGVEPGQQPVVVTTAGGASVSSIITVNAVEPGILAPPAFNLKAGQYAGAVFANTLTYAIPPGSVAGVAAARAKPGDVLTFYGVGFGQANPDSPAGIIVQASDPLKANFQASIGGVSATVLYAGLVQGYLGLYQFNVVVPNVPASDAAPFTFSVAGVSGTQKVMIAVQN